MKVLVAIDSSGYADEILDDIAARTWPAGSEFYLITAIETCSNWDAQQEFVHQGRIILENRVKVLKKRLPKYKIEGHVHEGSAAKLITKTAREWGAQLVYIGSHGDTGTRKIGIGSVAAAVVNEAPCSVEVVKLLKGFSKEKRASALASPAKRV